MPGAGRGMRFKRLILRCSFLESFLNSLSAAFLILLILFLLLFYFIMKDREEDVTQLRVEKGGRPESLEEKILTCTVLVDVLVSMASNNVSRGTDYVEYIE